MKSWILYGCAGLMAAALSACTSSELSKIPPAQTEKLDTVSEKWVNPYAHIHAGTIEFSFGTPRKTVTVPIDSLKKTILELPSTAWPFGGIIAADEGGPQGANDLPRDKKERTHEQFEEVCKSIGIVISWRA